MQIPKIKLQIVIFLEFLVVFTDLSFVGNPVFPCNATYRFEKNYLLGSPTGDPGALPGEETEDKGDRLETGSVFSLHRLDNGFQASVLATN